MNLQRTHKLSLLTRIAYGFGSVAYGVKDNGFGYFLLIFYGTVIGVDPALVGLAIFLALILDAISDPAVGYLSDNWRSKWGRRHPFMYASAIPVAISYFLLWNPPELGNDQMFWYLLILSILIRTLITLYETPSASLMPELSGDYDERTKLQAWRLYFGWTGGNMMSVLMFGVLLVATAEYPVGTLNRDGYTAYGIISSVLIFSSIMLSSLGTHSEIKNFKPMPPMRKIGLGTVFREIFETLGERSFFALFLATLFGAVATGVSGALAFLMLTYFWGFSGSQIFLWTLLVFVSALIGLLVAPRISKVLGKKRAVIVLGVVAYSMAPAPVILRLLGFMPENGDPILFPIVVAINTFDLALIIALQAILSSMIADLVEQSELKTGRRSEGIFFAAVTFTRKATQGLGVFAAGLILSVISFPQGAAVDGVSPVTLWQLGAFYAPSLLLLWTLMIVSVSFYKIGRQDHENNLQKLENLRASKSGERGDFR